MRRIVNTSRSDNAAGNNNRMKATWYYFRLMNMKMTVRTMLMIRQVARGK